MKKIEKRMLFAYIGGYLNTYYVERTTMDLSIDGYKQYRKSALFTYINRTYRSSSLIDNTFCYIVSTIEPLLSVLWVSILNILYLMKLFCTNSISLRNKTIIYDIGEHKLDTMLERSSISKSDVILITPPNGSKYNRSNYINYSAFRFLKFQDLLLSLRLSYKTIFCLWKRYRKRELIFRSYSSYNYYLAFCVLYRLSNNNDFIYFSTYNRWALLMSEMENFKTFIQHGIIDNYSFLIKCNIVDRAFFLSKKQAKVCKECLYKCIKETNYQSLIRINNEKLKNNSKKHILLICHSKFYEKELKYSAILSSYNCNLYLKYHPLDDFAPYEEMAKKNNAVLLGPLDFIMADYVFGYHSTLMEEYANIDASVHYYTDEDFDEIIENLKKL